MMMTELKQLLETLQQTSTDLAAMVVALAAIALAGYVVYVLGKIKTQKK